MPRQPAARLADPERTAREIARAPERLDAVIAALTDDRAAVRFHASKVLLALAEISPDTLLPKLRAVLDMLDSPNRFLKAAALRTLGYAARSDAHGQITRALPTILAPLAGPSLVVANNAIDSAARIADVKPQVADRVARALLTVPDGDWRTPDCRRIVTRRAARALARIQQQSRLRPETAAAVTSFLRSQGGE